MLGAAAGSIGDPDAFTGFAWDGQPCLNAVHLTNVVIVGTRALSDTHSLVIGVECPYRVFGCKPYPVVVGLDRLGCSP